MSDPIRAYHERTKHHLQRYAAGPDFLDWDHQPDPFRRFIGSPLVELPLESSEAYPPFDLIRDGLAPPLPFDAPHLGTLLLYALGLAAWKEHGGTRWALRCNPSSGNLHPTEGYLITEGVAGLADGVYHYAPHEHALETRCRFAPVESAGGAPRSEAVIPAGIGGIQTQGGESRLPSLALDSANPWRNDELREDARQFGLQRAALPRVWIGLSGIPWREAWKYGERALRYVQLDTGHALGAIRYAAAMLGWRVRPVAAADGEIAALLGLDRAADFGDAEREWPELLLEIVPAGESGVGVGPLLERAGTGEWMGRANLLSPHKMHRWPIIDATLAAAEGALPVSAAEDAAALPPPLPAPCAVPADALLRTRRSGQAFDGATPISAEGFYALLDRLLPRPDTPPWDLRLEPPRIHPVLFVHRVTGLPRGLYALPRTPQAAAAMREAFDDKFLWDPVEGAPPHLPLFTLVCADAREASRVLSCHQAIAADSAFSLGMLAEFDAALAQSPASYRHLYWEAGLLGQVLYLEAEAAGLRGTGIGCFFDDGVHELLGIADTRFQSLYHFTIGGAITDTRLRTLPPYAHLAGRGGWGP